MIRFLLIVSCLLLDVALLFGNEYTFSNGYYWKGGQAYTRSVVRVLDAHNCWVNTYQYTPYVAPTTTTNVTNITHETPNWRTKLLEIAEYREKSQAKIKQAALEHQEYLQALKALGLNGHGPGYTTTTTVDAYGYSQVPTAQGATVYGYNEIADVYARTDLGEIYNNALRLAEQSNKYGADATNGAYRLVDQLGDRASGLLSQQMAIAEIQAKTNGAKALVDSLKAESRLHIEKRTEGPPVPNPPAPGESPVLDEPAAKATGDVYDKLTALVNTKCVSCHGGKTTQAGLNLTDLGKLEQKQVDAIFSRITSQDSEKVMPPNKPLTRGEIGLFFQAVH